MSLLLFAGVANADTLIVYPDAGTGGTTTDADASNSSAATWVLARDSVSSNAVNNFAFLTSRVYQQNASSWQVSRPIMTVDTSLISAGGTILTATWSLKVNSFTDTDITNTSIASSFPLSNNNIVLADFSRVGGVAFSSLATGSLINGSYNDFVLNGAGILNINQIGISGFSIRNSRDLLDQAPTADNQVSFGSADLAGTTSDPKLTITFTPAPNNAIFFGSGL